MEDERWIEIEPVCQYPALPTGCEVTATSMFLSWVLNHPKWGNGSKMTSDSIDRMVLAERIVKEPDPFVDAQTGRTKGGNPHRAFVGLPTSRSSFGVFHEPIARLLDQEAYIEGHVLDLTADIQKAIALRKDEEDGDAEMAGRTRRDVAFRHIADCLDDGRPVIVWMTLELKEPHVTDEWYDCNVVGGGEADIIRWTSPEHCALLVGYSPTAVFINDPHTGKRERYDRDLFIDRWLHLGTQAITFRAS